MTKKHYEAIAKCIQGTLGSYPESRKALEMLTVYLCSTFEADNKLFDRSRFLAACGIVE